ncbi:hypothetical protein M514_07056 [Trichuris suis]|uniref:PDZ domain-containing protein n=1 Tax=Trichuris suis TaxID=68888 RepID=A0A085N8R1_9BILA|nr:hypothetical protein M514_07056 [Trichuris suis]
MNSVDKKKSYRSNETKSTTERIRASHSKDSTGPKKDDRRSRSTSVQAKPRHPAAPVLLDAKETKQQNEKKKATSKKAAHPKSAIPSVVQSSSVLNEKGSNRTKNRQKVETQKREISTANEKRPNAAIQSLSAAYLNPTLYRNVQKTKVDASKTANKVEGKSSTRGKPSPPAVIAPTTAGEDEHSVEAFEDDFEEYEEEDVEISLPTDERQELAVRADSPQVEHKVFTTDDGPMDQSQKPTQEKAVLVPSVPEGLPTIDFTKAVYNEDHWIAMQLLEERSIALKPYVQLDCETYNLCSIPPNEEESTFWYYSKAAGIEHKCVQTRDDNVDKETEPFSPFLEDKQTQHPMVRNFACTGDSESAGRISAFDSMEQREQCKKFVNHASSLLMRLIRSQPSKVVPKLGHSTQPFSKGSASLGLGLLGKRYKVTCTGMGSFAGKFKCIVGYQIEESALESFEQMGVLAIWGFKEFDKPQKLLLCEAEPTCCLLYEECAWAIAASGMDDGTVALWDLGEPDCWHRTIPWKASDVSVRRPTYDTAFFCGDEKDMCSKVVDILILNVQKNPTDESDALQLASLFENGQIIIWSVVKAVPAGRPLEKDGLLRPSGRVKMLKSSAIRAVVTQSLLGPKCSFSFCMASCGNEFFVGSGGGKIFKVPRYQDTSSFICYGTNSETSEVLCLKISPHDDNIYLAGMFSGTILLFIKTEREPVATLKMANEYGHLSAICVQWSTTTPFTFYSLHSPNVFVVWNVEEGTWRKQHFVLHKSVVAMSISEELTSRKKERGCALSFLVIGDWSTPLSKGQCIVLLRRSKCHLAKRMTKRKKYEGIVLHFTINKNSQGNAFGLGLKKRNKHLFVSSITRGSAAMDYFLVGDRIMLLNNKPVKSKRECMYLLQHSQRAIDVTVERFLEVDPGPNLSKRKVLLNFRIRTDLETRPFGLGVKTKKGRVVVTSVRENSVSADYFRIDDSIMMINNVQIDSKEKCREQVRKQKGIIDVVIEREEETKIEHDSYAEVCSCESGASESGEEDVKRKRTELLSKVNTKHWKGLPPDVQRIMMEQYVQMKVQGVIRSKNLPKPTPRTTRRIAILKHCRKRHIGSDVKAGKRLRRAPPL